MRRPACVLMGLVVGPVAGFPSGAAVGALINTTGWFEGAAMGAGIGVYLGLTIGVGVAAIGPLARDAVRSALAGTVLGIGMGYVLWSDEMQSRWAFVCAVVGMSVGLLVFMTQKAMSPPKPASDVCEIKDD